MENSCLCMCKETFLIVADRLLLSRCSGFSVLSRDCGCEFSQFYYVMIFLAEVNFSTFSTGDGNFIYKLGYYICDISFLS